MKIRLKSLGILEFIAIFKDKKEIEIDFAGNTAGDLVHHLLTRMEPAEKRLFLLEQQGILTDLIVFVNGKLIPAPDQLKQPLGAGDLVELMVDSGG